MAQLLRGTKLVAFKCPIALYELSLEMSIMLNTEMTIAFTLQPITVGMGLPSDGRPRS